MVRRGAVFDASGMLTRDDIDAVVIATPVRAPIMLEALKAGKDVYVEKHMSIELDMANEAVDLARAKERVVQVGTQRRSEGRWRAAQEFLGVQGLGTLTRVSSSVCFNHPRWARDVSDCKAEDVDWDAYLFNREKVPFDPNLIRRWHLYKMCTNGLAGLWMVHLVDTPISSPAPPTRTARSPWAASTCGKTDGNTVTCSTRCSTIPRASSSTGP